ncbi:MULTISPECIES: MHYT domain-containing protein [Streptomyces]|uniref:MHYT domain-containing protein n=1 Tax=Streptomyces sudanensis TaxID=436397 RepID=A0ABY4TFY0_9ACTN|nr:MULTISPECIES: MHYT domain-containing protein [Streptomyces]URN15707.1 hypothetical protein MW084_06730 [Streptomyces sudanensis]
MRGTVDAFGDGLAAPLAACLAACLGGALGLHCTTRSLRTPGAPRPGWLALAAASVGTGTWGAHFLAMTGFRAEGAPVHHDRPAVLAGLAVAVLMAGAGTFLVGLRGRTAMTLVTGGAITGLGIATTHYLGMAGARLPGRVEYHTPAVVLSAVIAVVAATAALWAAAGVRGFAANAGAGLVLGLAVVGMHYTGTAAVSVHVHHDGAAAAHAPAGAPGTAGAPGPADGVPGAAGSGTPPASLAPLLLGPAVFLLLAGAAALLGPARTGGDPPGAAPRRRGAGG